jgi:hypothetical protein
VLWLPRRRRWAEGVRCVGVAGEFAPGGDRAGAVLPLEPGDRLVRDGSERLDGPVRAGGGGLYAELVTAVVGVGGAGR